MLIASYKWFIFPPLSDNALKRTCRLRYTKLKRAIAVLLVDIFICLLKVCPCLITCGACFFQVVYRDFNCWKILLDNHFAAKLAGCGLDVITLKPDKLARASSMVRSSTIASTSGGT